MIFNLLGLPRLWFSSCTPYRVSGITVSLYSYEKMCFDFLGDSCILRIPRIPVSPWFSTCFVSLGSDFCPVPPTEGLVSLYPRIPMKKCVWFFWETLVFFVSLVSPYPHENMVLVFLGGFCPEKQKEGLVSLYSCLPVTCLCCCREHDFCPYPGILRIRSKIVSKNFLKRGGTWYASPYVWYYFLYSE